jgi:hypothetical protein
VYPYFDNYNVITGSFPTSGSRSLLFNNEQATLGSTPQNSLIDEYWRTYLELLYDPRTRLVNASAVIPFAAYFNMQLNDLVQFRGNYYHLRAINDYDLTSGECMVQLLGPVISDAVSVQLFGTEKKKTPVNLGDFNCDFSEDFNNGDLLCSTCCAPSLTGIGIDGSNLLIDFNLNVVENCIPCSYVSFISSSDGFITFSTPDFTASCSSPATLPYNGSQFEYIMRTNCLYGQSSPFSSPIGITDLAIDYVVVAGGGGGGTANGGGGGAGGFISGSTTISSGYYNITVGAGGAGGIFPTGASNGGNSMFLNVTASGGGGGAVGGTGPPGPAVGNGGSGAGGSSISGGGGTGTAGQGNNGGNASPGIPFGSGGGGGARSTGSNAVGGLFGNSGNGGAGAQWVDGLYYAGGGGGGFSLRGDGDILRNGATGGWGGIGGGGYGAANVNINPATAGVDGTGGGGGDGGNGGIPQFVNGGKGGDGIVKIRYAGSGSKASGGNTFFSGSYTYHSFGNTTGSYTFQVF